MNFTSLKSFINTPIEKIQQVMSNNFTTTSSKEFTESEIHAFNMAKMSFNFTLEKCCSKGFVNPSIKDLISNFEKARYDISKMDIDIFKQLSSTYKDFQYGFSIGVKTASSKLYCDIYELFSGAKFKEMVNVITSSPFFTKNRISLESVYNDYNFLERVDAAVNSYIKNDDHWDKSYENFINYALDIFHNDKFSDEIESSESGPFAATTVAIQNLTKGINATRDAIGGISSVLILFIVILSTLLIVLILIFIHYTRCLNESVIILTEKATGKEILAKKLPERVLNAITNSDAQIPPITKTLLFKPANLGINYITSSMKFDSNVIRKSLDLVYSATNGKENYSNEESSESAGGALMITAIVIATMITIVPVARLCCYWIHHFNVQLRLFFKENKEILSVNIDELLERYNDPSTPPDEKKRLKAIIKRQEAWCQSLAKWSKTTYSSQLETCRKIEREIRQDDSRDFDHDAYEAEDVSKSTDVNNIQKNLDDGNTRGPIDNGSIDF